MFIKLLSNYKIQNQKIYNKATKMCKDKQGKQVKLFNAEGENIYFFQNWSQHQCDLCLVKNVQVDVDTVTNSYWKDCVHEGSHRAHEFSSLKVWLLQNYPHIKKINCLPWTTQRDVHKGISTTICEETCLPTSKKNVNLDAPHI